MHPKPAMANGGGNCAQTPHVTNLRVDDEPWLGDPGFFIGGGLAVFVEAGWISHLLQPIIETEGEDLGYFGVFFKVRMAGVDQKVLIRALGEEDRGNQ